MKFSISRDALIKPLNLVGVVERRQTHHSVHVLLVLEAQRYRLRVQTSRLNSWGAELESAGVDGEVTVPARKLVDICKRFRGFHNRILHDSGKAIVGGAEAVSRCLRYLRRTSFCGGGAGAVSLALDCRW